MKRSSGGTDPAGFVEGSRSPLGAGIGTACASVAPIFGSIPDTILFLISVRALKGGETFSKRKP
jgi:hypothetical protein